jgi:hypothetical protein
MSEGRMFDLLKYAVKMMLYSAIVMCLMVLIVLGLMFFGLPFYEELLWIPVLPMGVGMVLYTIAGLRGQAE